MYSLLMCNEFYINYLLHERFTFIRNANNIYINKRNYMCVLKLRDLKITSNILSIKFFKFTECKRDFLSFSVFSVYFINLFLWSSVSFGVEPFCYLT